MNQDGTKVFTPVVFGYRTSAGCDLNELAQTLTYISECDRRYREIELILESHSGLLKTSADTEQIHCALLVLLNRARNSILKTGMQHGKILLRMGANAGKIQVTITTDGVPDPPSGVLEPLLTRRLEDEMDLAMCAQIIQDEGGELYAWRPRDSTITTLIIDLPSA